MQPVGKRFSRELEAGVALPPLPPPALGALSSGKAVLLPGTMHGDRMGLGDKLERDP